MRNLIIRKYLKIERVLGEQGIIQIEKGSMDTGYYMPWNNRINMTLHLGGIFYYEAVFHEITHFLEYNFWKEVCDIRARALENLMEALKDYRYMDNLYYAFAKSQPPSENRHPYYLEYPEFFPTLIENLYIKHKWQHLKTSLKRNERKMLYNYFNILANLFLDKYNDIVYNNKENCIRR